MSALPPQGPPQPYPPTAAATHESLFTGTPAKKKPWLPLKHIIGLGVVAAFTIAGITGTVGVNGWLTGVAAEEGEWVHPDYNVDLYAELSNALRSDDRDAFVSWGEGEGAEQLARLWDETKKIGWSTGYVDGNDLRVDPEDDMKTIDQPHFTIGFDLGFTNKRLPNAAEDDAGGILVHSFEYDVDISEDTQVAKRITAIHPKTPMPWDDESGAAVARADNVVLFGFAHEQAALDANIADAQFGARGVLDTGYAEAGNLELRGFTTMIATDRTQHLDAAYGETYDEAESDREWTEAGLAKGYAVPRALGQDITDLYTGFSGTSGTLVFIGDAGLGDGMARTAAHEFAHALHIGIRGIDMSFLDNQGSAEQAVTEGFARYVEDRVVGPRDGYSLSMQPAVLQAVASAQSVDALLSASAFAGSDTASMAYDIAGNYFQFITSKGENPVTIVSDAGSYQSFPFELWTVYFESPSGDSLSAEAWQEWAAAQ